MLSREDFKKFMIDLIALKKDEEALNDAFKKFEPDFNYICFSRYETLVVKCLEKAMEDKYEYISYFLYERDAEFTKKKIIQDKKGKKIPFDNYDDLYNIIVDGNKVPDGNVKEAKEPKSTKKKEQFKFPWQ